MFDGPIQLSHDVFNQLVHGVPPGACQCRCRLRELLGYPDPVSWTRVRWVRLVVCDECDLAIKLVQVDRTTLRTINTYPYRPNVRIGRRRRRGR